MLSKKYVVSFYAIACIWSWPLFFLRDIHPEIFRSWAVPNFVKTWLLMWGPGISALLHYAFLKKEQFKEIRFGFKDQWKLWMCYLLFVGLLAALNRDPKYLLFGLIGFISSTGEELGWRGFLQDALRGLPTWKRYVLVGVLWEFWHFTNRTTHGTINEIVIRVAAWCLVLICLSFLMGILVEKTKSLAPAVIIHTGFNCLFELKNSAVPVATAMILLVFFAFSRSTIKPISRGL